MYWVGLYFHLIPVQFEIRHNTVLFNLAMVAYVRDYLLWNTKYANVRVIQNDIGLVHALCMCYVLRLYGMSQVWARPAFASKFLHR